VGKVSPVEEVKGLSKQARSIWGKSDYGIGERWLPLYVHMADSASVISHLWDEWLSESLRKAIARPLGGDLGLARRACIFLGSVHDIGKATPIFQAKGIRPNFGSSGGGLVWMVEHAGLPVRHDLGSRSKPTHPVAGEYLLAKALQDIGWKRSVALSYADIVGAHHGNFQGIAGFDMDVSNRVAIGSADGGVGDWPKVQEELIRFCLAISGLTDSDLQKVSSVPLPAATACLFTGLVTMCDWIASDTDFYPLVQLMDAGERRIDFDGRESAGWHRVSLTPAWREPMPKVKPFDEFFSKRFSLPAGASPRPIQSAAMHIALETKEPGLIIIEAPMGEGKTEGALAAAEVLAVRTGAAGVCIALPTMATTDAMFARVEYWLERLPQDQGIPEKSIYLAHGKAQLNEKFQGIVHASRESSLASVASVEKTGRAVNLSMQEHVVASDWMFGRKKGMLSNFVVCTVDQVLMAALDMRHLPLRQLSIAGKIVIIDECHAYDLYMRQYLFRVLQWLGYWHTPVILLSATLPSDLRRHMTDWYLCGWKASESIAKPNAFESRQRKLTTGCWSRAGKESAGTQPVSSRADASLAPEARLDDYPLITYTDGSQVKRIKTEASGRGVDVVLSLIDDGLDTLVSLLSERLSGGGCAGVICDTVSRAQEVAAALSGSFGRDVVSLDHSRFMDLDRMENEKELTSRLGRDATRENGRRPELSIVVGTQVLEQSLDIDFDVLVTDVAPIDLLMQRLGRMHRHQRGKGESSRPEKLRSAECFIRGIEEWKEDLPSISKSIAFVYQEAPILESLAVLGLVDAGSRTEVSLPNDIPRLVRTAYSRNISAHIPERWREEYQKGCEARESKEVEKTNRAKTYLLSDVKELVREQSNLSSLASHNQVRGDEDRGQRAVRDTQESIEVLLVREHDGGGISLLPWVSHPGVEAGEEIPTYEEPRPALAKLIAQCAVRLPLSACPISREDECIGELEEKCGRYVGAWQESPWLAGRLLLPMREMDDGSFEATVLGNELRYTRRDGLSTVRRTPTPSQPN
jgi:CRISPR-associated endonuclease/helicase Cas3